MPRKVLQINDIRSPLAGGSKGRDAQRMHGDAGIEAQRIGVTLDQLFARPGQSGAEPAEFASRLGPLLLGFVALLLFRLTRLRALGQTFRGLLNRCGGLEARSIRFEII